MLRNDLVKATACACSDITVVSHLDGLLINCGRHMPIIAITEIKAI